MNSLRAKRVFRLGVEMYRRGTAVNVSAAMAKDLIKRGYAEEGEPVDTVPQPVRKPAAVRPEKAKAKPGKRQDAASQNGEKE